MKRMLLICAAIFTQGLLAPFIGLPTDARRKIAEFLPVEACGPFACTNLQGLEAVAERIKRGQHQGISLTPGTFLVMLDQEFITIKQLEAASCVHPGLIQWGRVLGRLREDNVNTVAWASDGTRIAVGTKRGYIRVLNTVSGIDAACLAAPGANHSVAWSPDGTKIAVGASLNNNVQVLDVVSAAVVVSLPHKTWSSSVAWSRDGTRLAVGLVDGTVSIWDFASRSVLARTTGCIVGSAQSVAWSTDGTRIAYHGAFEREVKACDATDGREVACLQHKETVFSVAWSPDGTRIASVSRGGMIRVWDVSPISSGDACLAEHGLAIEVAWSPDGTMLALGSSDGCVQVLNATSGTAIACFKGHPDRVNSIAWSPDGARLASGSHDGTVRVWDVSRSARVLWRRLGQEARFHGDAHRALPFQGGL